MSFSWYAYLLETSALNIFDENEEKIKKRTDEKENKKEAAINNKLILDKIIQMYKQGEAWGCLVNLLIRTNNEKEAENICKQTKDKNAALEFITNIKNKNNFLQNVQTLLNANCLFEAIRCV